MTYETEISAALYAAKLAGNLLSEEYKKFQAIPDAPASITTDADRNSQEAILTHLCKLFPEDAFCAEEDTPTLRKSSQTGSRMWIIDPIDGTRGFAKKNGEFSVMIALVDDGKIVVGVVLEPAQERLTYASDSRGCWRQDYSDSEPQKCSVSSASVLSESTLTQSHSKKTAEPPEMVRALRPMRVVETYSAGIKLALVARGEADLYVNSYRAFSDWDICAGQILVKEAGGIVTGLAGEKIEYTGNARAQRSGLLATNGRLHEAATRLLVK